MRLRYCSCTIDFKIVSGPAPVSRRKGRDLELTGDPKSTFRNLCLCGDLGDSSCASTEISSMFITSSDDWCDPVLLESVACRNHKRLDSKDAPCERLLVATFTARTSSISAFFTVRSTTAQVEVAYSALLLVVRALVVVPDPARLISRTKTYSLFSLANSSGFFLLALRIFSVSDSG